MDKLFNSSVAEQPLLYVLLKAAFIAVVSFGAVGGVLAAAAPRFTFGLSEKLICPRGSTMAYDEWNDGYSDQFRVYCASPDSILQPKERTLAALAVVMAMFYLAIFYIALMVLLVIRARAKAKYGVG